MTSEAGIEPNQGLGTEPITQQEIDYIFERTLLLTTYSTKTIVRGEEENANNRDGGTSFFQFVGDGYKVYFNGPIHKDPNTPQEPFTIKYQDEQIDVVSMNFAPRLSNISIFPTRDEEQESKAQPIIKFIVYSDGTYYLWINGHPVNIEKNEQDIITEEGKLVLSKYKNWLDNINN